MATIIHADLQLDTDALLNRCGLQDGGRVQMAIDNAVIRYDSDYCPYETGTLANSPYSASPPGSGQVIYNTPYARYLYYGQVMGPNIPVFEDDSGVPTRYFSPPGQKKHLTGRTLKYNQDMNPLAGAFWFERMKAAHLQDIIEEARNVAINR
jgi:hypothetical protein